VLQVVVETQDGITVARLCGHSSDVSNREAAAALERVVADPGARVAIDLSGVQMLDSMGLSMLMNVVARARLTDGRVVLVAPSAFVAGVLRVTALDRWFDIRANIAEARLALG